MRVPQLHVVTDDAVLADPGFEDRALELMAAHGGALALHLRGHGTPGGTLFRLADALAAPARDAGTTLVVNDRLDVALAAGCGAQVGRRSLPLAVARRLLGPGRVVGYSAHAPPEARAAAAAGADWVVLGTVWESDSHAGGVGAGTGLIADVAAIARAPIIAIGGVTPARAAEALDAGAHGVAVLSGVWGTTSAAEAAGRYLESMGAMR